MKNWTPEELFKKTFDFWESCILHTAVHLDVFSALSSDPLTMEELAAKIQVDTRGVSLLVNALAAMELLERDESKAKLTEFSHQFLCKESPSYMGYLVLHGMDEVLRFTKLSESVKSGKELSDILLDNTPEGFERFIMGMKDKADDQARVIVPKIDLSNYNSLLDFGGGTGAYAIHFCSANPNMNAVVYDLPIAKPFADRVLAEANMQDRISFVGGNFLEEDVPVGFDVVWVSQILHSYSQEVCLSLLEKAVRALNPGGMILIQEFFLNDDFSGPLFPAVFGVNMLVNTSGGGVYTKNQVEDWLKTLGISETSRPDITFDNGCGIVSGVKKA